MTTAPTGGTEVGYWASRQSKPAGQAQEDPGSQATLTQTRSLRASASLTSFIREGLFVEVSDAYGTTGWVSVEDLK